ncbi:MAG: ABC transporter permease subunit [Deltaproteobacteria bacterium]|nr:ABC transporter permease subunit [Deltaproteobacteria bacterium]MBW2255170.1 ABC transporter permease subunit [Deltaproteobacteria bacterium]
MNTLVIAGRELRSIFDSTVGWLVLAGFLFVTGIFWAAYVSIYAINSTEALANPYATYQMSFADYLFMPFFLNTSIVLMMLCPAVSMRLFSEEIKEHTIELLLTSPVGTLDIVLGKFLGALGFVGVMLLATSAGPLMLWLWASPNLGEIAGGYLALFLVAAAMLSMGMFFSSMTSNQIVAVVWTFAASLALFAMAWNQDTDSVLYRYALESNYSDLLSGLVYVSHLVYFLAFVGFFVFATWQRVESFRWS